jgi:hypothetical protein
MVESLENIDLFFNLLDNAFHLFLFLSDQNGVAVYATYFALRGGDTFYIDMPARKNDGYSVEQAY